MTKGVVHVLKKNDVKSLVTGARRATTKNDKCVGKKIAGSAASDHKNCCGAPLRSFPHLLYFRSLMAPASNASCSAVFDVKHEKRRKSFAICKSTQTCCCLELAREN